MDNMNVRALVIGAVGGVIAIIAIFSLVNG